MSKSTTPNETGVHVQTEIHETDEQISKDLALDQDLLAVGHQVIERQKAEGFWLAWKNNWRAAGWSLFISMALWMEGFDQAILGTYFGQPQFKEYFGVSDGQGGLVIPNATQAGLSNTATCGQIVGLVITGICQEWIGSKRTFIYGMVFMIITIFVAVFAQSLAMLYAAEVLMGIPWGMFQTLSTAYAAEICPLNMRGYLAAWASMGWGGGRFLATGILRGTLNMEGEWAWRLPYALQWIWPVPLVCFVWMAPESPWWLVRKGRYDDAKAVVRRSSSQGVYTENDIDGYIEYMKHTDALDRTENANGAFADMFKGTNLRRTEIQLGVWAAQLWNGNAVSNLAVQFFQKAGMSVGFSFSFNLIINALSIVGVAVSWVLLRYYGRRPIYIWGIVSIIISNVIIGILGAASDSSAVAYVAGGLMSWINFAFHFSLGPVCYTIVGELPASRLRARSIVLGRLTYVVNQIIVNTISPYTTNGWGALSGFFWAGTGVICFVWCFFRMPETGGFSFAELDILFSRKVSARHFKDVTIHEFEPHGDHRNTLAATDEMAEKQEHAHLEKEEHAHIERK